MHENQITNIVTVIDAHATDLKQTLTHIIQNTERKIHSLIVYGVWSNDKLISWESHFNISQSNKFNTIKCDDELCQFLYDKLTYSKSLTKTVYVICYKQPDVSLLIKQYKPLTIKLAREQNSRWTWLELEDLIQMCNLVICDLYYKGYYVHKRLIRKSFNNYVLMHIRKDIGKNIVSIEQKYKKGDNDDELTIADMLLDNKLILEQEDKYNDEIHSRILQEVKEIIIDFVGPRQYDQLLREYKNRQTTDWSRKLMQTIKAHLFEMGISSKSFNKYYE